MRKVGCRRSVDWKSKGTVDSLVGNSKTGSWKLRALSVIGRYNTELLDLYHLFANFGCLIDYLFIIMDY